MKHTIKKQIFEKEEISYMEIILDNGDSIPIAGSEITEISLRLCDKLTVHKDHTHGAFCPVVHDGNIRLKLKKLSGGAYCPKVYDEQNFNKNRTAYIKNRLTKEGGIECVQIYDENNWHFSYYGNISAELDGEDVVIVFTPKEKNEPFESDEHFVLLNEVHKVDLYYIYIDLENCEGFNVDEREIVEFELEISKELERSGGNYLRKVESGFITIHLNPKFNESRGNHFFNKLKSGESGNRQIERRLAGKKLFDMHDICNLYINYAHSASENGKCECIGVEELRSNEEFDAMEKFEERTGEEWPCAWHVGGYCEKRTDGTLFISFGKTALENEKFQSLLQEASVLNAKE